MRHSWKTLTNALMPLVASLGFGLGCGGSTENEVSPTPGEVVEPQPADDTATENQAAEAAETTEMKTEAVPEPPEEAATSKEAEAESEPERTPEPPAEPKNESEPPAEPKNESEPPAEPEDPDTADVELTPMSMDQLAAEIAQTDAPYTLVDCWASWCAPCKENFPHVIEMAEAYKDTGLRVVALAFDGGTGDPDEDARRIAAARGFLADKDLEHVDSMLVADDLVAAFETFDITTIPAVFIYDGEGNIVKRYTWDDPNNQFTYDQVERELAELLGVDPKGIVPTEAETETGE